MPQSGKQAMKQAQNQEKASPRQNNRLGNAFRAVTQEINPRLEKSMLSDLGFCFCLKQISKANHSQVDYFANEPTILGFRAAETSYPPAKATATLQTHARTQPSLTRVLHILESVLALRTLEC